MQNNFSLEELKKLGREHWKLHRPKLFKSLSQSGDLNESLNNAAQSTLNAHRKVKGQLKERGYIESLAHHTAWELVREEWLLRPSEEQPDLESSQSGNLSDLLSQEDPPRRMKLSK
jgi:hypothetical protein